MQWAVYRVGGVSGSRSRRLKLPVSGMAALFLLRAISRYHMPRGAFPPVSCAVSICPLAKKISRLQEPSMSDQQIKRLLSEAATSLRGRQLTSSEADELYRQFVRQDGPPQKKAISVLIEASHLSEPQIAIKRASDDNCDRVMRDLENVLRK